MGEERRQLAYEAFRQHNGALHEALKGNPALTHSLAAQLQSGRNPVIPAETAATVQLTIGLPPSHQASHLLQAVGSAIKTNHKCLRRFVRKLKREQTLQSVAEEISTTYSELLSQHNQSESEDSDVDPTVPEIGQKWWSKYTSPYCVAAVIMAVFAVLVVVYLGWSGDETNPLLTYRKSFQDIYLAHYEDEWQWPRLKKSQFIRLTLVKMENNHFDEFTRRTIVGSVDDILHTKEEITFQKVFQFDHGSKGARILIEGRPGSGKTTLMGKISREWAEGNILADCVVFLLVPLRTLLDREKIELKDMLDEHFLIDEILTIERWLIRSGGDGLCLGLDGIDEHPAMAVKGIRNYVFNAFLKGKLPNSCIILSSRPAATESLREEASKSGKYIEVVGFLKEEIRQFISEYYAEKNKPNKSEELLSYLEVHPNIMHMTYLPLNLVIIVYLFDLMGTSLPETETDIYTEFTRQTLLRYAHKNGSDDCEIHTLDSLCHEVPPMQECFAAICQLAYESLRENELIFGEKYLPSNICNGLGFLIEDRRAGLSGIRRSYSFLHLTFQEFLAAFHITRLSPEQQIQAFNCTVENCIAFSTDRVHMMDEVDRNYITDIITCVIDRIVSGIRRTYSFLHVTLQDLLGAFHITRQLSPEEKFQGIFIPDTISRDRTMDVVFKFYAGLTRLNTTHSFEVFKIYLQHCLFRFSSGFSSDTNTIVLLSAFESNSSSSATEILSAMKGVVDDGMFRLMPHHYPVVKFLLINANHAVKQASIMYAESLRSFATSKSFPELKIIKLTQIPYTVGDVSGGPYPVVDVRNLIEKSPNLEEFKMNFMAHRDLIRWHPEINWSMETSSENVCSIVSALANCPNLQKVILDGEFGEKGAACLAQGSWKNLKALWLCFHDMGNASLSILATGLRGHTELKELMLIGRKVDDESICSLAAALINNSKLETLGLSFIFGEKGAACLAQRLRECWKNLKSLSLYNHEIGDKDLSELASGLRSNEDLEQLSLISNKLGDEGICNLAAALTNKPKIQRLKLHYDSIGDKGAACLAQVLKEGWIKEVIIEKNTFQSDIDSTGVELLKQACTKTCSLTTVRPSILYCKYYDRQFN